MRILYHVLVPDFGLRKVFAEGDETTLPGIGEWIVFEEEGGVLDAGRIRASGVPAAGERPGTAGTGRMTRRMGEDDRARRSRNTVEAERLCGQLQRFSRQQGMNVRIVKARYSLQRRKVTLWYVPAGMVDTRVLESEIRRRTASTIILLESVGAREAAGRLGGCGPCGRELCCAAWLRMNSGAREDAGNGWTAPPVGADRVPETGLCGRGRCCWASDPE